MTYWWNHISCDWEEEEDRKEFRHSKAVVFAYRSIRLETPRHISAISYLLFNKLIVLRSIGLHLETRIPRENIYSLPREWVDVFGDNRDFLHSLENKRRYSSDNVGAIQPASATSGSHQRRRWQTASSIAAPSPAWPHDIEVRKKSIRKRSRATNESSTWFF